MSNQTNKPTFESHAEATIKRATETFGQRGTEYGDDWAKPCTLTLRAVCHRFGINIPPQYERAIMWAVLCDLKYQRRTGGYKDDTMLDSINYEAVLAEEMRQYEEADKLRTSAPVPSSLDSSASVLRTCPVCRMKHLPPACPVDESSKNQAQ